MMNTNAQPNKNNLNGVDNNMTRKEKYTVNQTRKQYFKTKRRAEKVMEAKEILNKIVDETLGKIYTTTGFILAIAFFVSLTALTLNQLGFSLEILSSVVEFIK